MKRGEREPVMGQFAFFLSLFLLSTNCNIVLTIAEKLETKQLPCCYFAVVVDRLSLGETGKEEEKEKDTKISQGIGQWS